MIVSTRNVMLELFNHSKATLSDEKLNWIDGLSDVAESEAVNAAETLLYLGVIHGAAEPSNLPSTEQLSAILLGLSNQVESLSALISISNEATYLVGERTAAKAKAAGTKKPA